MAFRTKLIHLSRALNLQENYLAPLKRLVHQSTPSLSNSSGGGQSKSVFDVRILDVLACPLSKKSLRYDAANNELICDELGVAYPIINGIPNLNPQDGRMIQDDSSDITNKDEK